MPEAKDVQIKNIEIIHINTPPSVKESQKEVLAQLFKSLLKKSA